MNPGWDFHALAPIIVITATIVVVLVADFFFEYRGRFRTSLLASLGVLAAMVPIVTMAADGGTRVLFGGAIVVDDYTLALQGFFLAVTYVTLLLSVDYIGDGDYYQGEFYVLLLTSLLGMMVMAAARDLISIFVALETVSIPTFVLAGWRKHDRRSNEAAIKYYLIGVLSSALMLYGMSLVFGLTGSTLLVGIKPVIGRIDEPLLIVAVFLTLAGFAFKVSAVPFHFWAPDTYEGAPTPVTAYLSVASKAAGFVALLNVVYFGFFDAPDTWQPVLWVLAAASMLLGNLAALRQTDIVRMLAYSSIAQGGFILVPFAVAGSGDARVSSFEAVVVYLLIYGAMNLGAFAVVIALARRTRSTEISSYAGLGSYAPGLALAMSMFLFSLAGIPPFAGWFAKFVMFRSVLDATTPAATVLGAIAAVSSVIAFFYYARVAREMWFHPAPDGADTTPMRLPVALDVAMVICGVVVLVVGVYPQLFARIGELAAGG
ncbi:MAG: NADH-quinone oxidoreductase subunit N [Actinobacteria bacterium]|nr:NADH-quinone oxidoreductase subunit N [Actinomycetota bacterium]